ncbi:MAG TPA: hypothetical protein PLQ93_10705 [Bacteroidia bacterium]|nr:hypothetical protein [Bacteroidia bacterium]
MKPLFYYVAIGIGVILTLVTGDEIWWQKLIGIPVWFLLAMFIAWLTGFFWRAEFWKRVKMPFLIFLYFGIINQVATANYSGSSGNVSFKSHKCTYCGQKYKHFGYYHLEYDCIAYETDPGFDDHCSVKCCAEDWKINGKGKFH